MKVLTTLLLLFMISSYSSKTNNGSIEMKEVLNVKSRKSMVFSKHLPIIKSKLTSLVMLFSALNMSGQDLNNIQMPEVFDENIRKVIHIPDIQGFKTLKCDFHMHTVFSDGVVWPTVRVDEAWREGLDAIAITDHIEKNPSKRFIGGDDNSSYEIAKPYATEKNILLIRGGEITRKMPPGHFNALFLQDVNALDKKDFMDSFEAARKQGAFIIWNHPGWKAQQPDTCKWWDIHTELLEKGMLHAVEVFNEKEFYPITLDWCSTKNLAYTAASDIHGIISDTYNLEDFNRPMTLVFARERTEEALREALFARRTVAWFGNFLAGNEEYLLEIFKASVSVSSRTENQEGKNYLIKNTSDIPYNLMASDGTSYTIAASGETLISLSAGKTTLFEVTNLLIKTGKNLKVEFPLE